MTSLAHPAAFVVTPADEQALRVALQEARRFRGATSPNPPVGAAALGSDGRLLAVAAHEKAGKAHAEVRVLEACRARGVLDDITTLVVTLEPCNHSGNTPPCSKALCEAGVPRVVFGATDPNPAACGGADTLLKAGVQVVQPPIGSDIRQACEELIAPFSHFVRLGTPWITIKTAHRDDGSMQPLEGHKTFTSADSLRYAHGLRKRADAIITGSGTVLADNPLFTVRHVADFPNKQRWLAVLDRRRRVPDAWLEGARQRGFQVERFIDVAECLAFLGRQGVVEALVEAGPTLGQFVLDAALWQEHVRIQCRAGMPDLITHVYRNH